MRRKKYSKVPAKRFALQVKAKKKKNKNKQKKYVKLNITNKLLTKTPNRRCQFDVDITSIHKKKQKKNYL